MRKLGPAFEVSLKGWRRSIVLFVLPSLLCGFFSELMFYLGVAIGDARIPMIPSGVALALLLALGWRAMPGVVVGLWGAALWGAWSSEIPWTGWELLLPLGGCVQAAVSYALARRIAPMLFETSSAWELGGFLAATGPVGSAVGVLFACAAVELGNPVKLVSLLMSGATWWLFDIISCLAVVSFSVGFMSRAPRPFVSLAMVAAAAGMLLGAAVGFGWLTNDAVLIQVAPELTPMQFNTALCFLLCGMGLVLIIHGRPRVAVAVALLPGTVGMLTLLEYVLKRDFGIDQFFIEHYITVNTTFPGRMAPNTALCFVLFGLALTQSGRGSRGSHVAASTLYSMVASCGLLAVLSYVAGIDNAFTWAAMTPMAIHTAVGFVVLGLGGLAREVVQLEGAPRRISLSPIPTGVALAAAAIWIWQVLYHDEQEKIRLLAHDRAVDIARMIDLEVTYHNRSQVRMADRWFQIGGSSPEIWSADARSHLRDFPTVAAIAWADSTSHVRWLEPIEGNEEIIGFDLSSHPQGKAVVGRVLETGRQASTDVIEISTIGRGFLVLSPIGHEKGITGFIVGLYRIDRLFDILSPATMKNYMFRVVEKGEVVFESDVGRVWPVDGEDGMGIEQKMRGGAWTLQLIPRSGWLDSQRSNLSLLILIAGLVLAGATTMALLLLEAVRAQYDVIEMSENRLRQLVDCAPTGLITTDLHGIIREVNPEARRQFGYGDSELLGQPVEVLIPGHFRDTHLRHRIDFGRQPMSRAMGKGRNLTALKKDGRDFPVEVSLAPFQTLEGLHILAIVTDITERDEARRKLEAHTRALELINKDLDDFAYVASHDLRAPLTAITSLVQWLEEDTAALLPESSVKHLTLIRSRVSRMAKLLEDLLIYSRAGRITNRIERVDTAELVGQVVELIRGAGPLEIRTSGLPVFDTVRTPLQQVLRNLISNAIKHHDREACTIEITAKESGPFHVFRIADDGPGIPPQFHDKVFNMFQTLRPRDEVEGSGMGLALVRKLVERYGGMVYLIETPGRGTTIEFTWPTRLSGG